MLLLYCSPVVDYHDMRFMVRVSHSNKIPDYKVDSIHDMKVYVKVAVYLHSFLISVLGWRWLIRFTPWSPYAREKSRVYILKIRLVGPQGLFCMRTRWDKSLAPVGVRNLDRQAGSIVTIGYRLSYPYSPNVRQNVNWHMVTSLLILTSSSSISQHCAVWAKTSFAK